MCFDKLAFLVAVKRREAADLDPDALTSRSDAATDADADADTTAWYADDPLPPSARLLPALASISNVGPS